MEGIPNGLRYLSASNGVKKWEHLLVIVHNSILKHVGNCLANDTLQLCHDLLFFFDNVLKFFLL